MGWRNGLCCEHYPNHFARNMSKKHTQRRLERLGWEGSGGGGKRRRGGKSGNLLTVFKTPLRPSILAFLNIAILHNMPELLLPPHATAIIPSPTLYLSLPLSLHTQSAPSIPESPHREKVGATDESEPPTTTQMQALHDG